VIIKDRGIIMGSHVTKGRIVTMERRNIMDNKIKTVCNIIEGIILVDIILARNTGPAPTETLTVPCHLYNAFYPIECILVASKGI
jgi:hypothetical protein